MATDPSFGVIGSQRSVRDRGAESLERLHYSLSSVKRMSKQTPHSAAVSKLQDIIAREETSKRQKEVLSEANHGHHPSKAHLTPNPDELFPLVSRYKTMVDHLENENVYLKDSLDYVRKSAKDVIEDNEMMNRRFKETLRDKIEDIIGDSATVSNRDTTVTTERNSPEKPLMRTDKSTTTVGITTLPKAVQTDKSEQKLPASNAMSLSEESGGLTIVEDELEKVRQIHKAKSDHLESLLQSTRDDLDLAYEEMAKLRNQLRQQQPSTDESHADGFCIACSRNNAILPLTYSKAHAKVIDRLEREKEELLETIDKQRKKIADLWQRESAAVKEVQKSLDLAQQLQLEKYELAVQCKQLEEKASKGQERSNRRISDLNEKLGQQKKLHVSEQLKDRNEFQTQMNELTETLTAEKVLVERLRREKDDLKTEIVTLSTQLQYKEKLIVEINDEFQRSKIEGTRKQVTAEQDAAIIKRNFDRVQEKQTLELERLKHSLEESERRTKVAEERLEQSRLELVETTEKLIADESEILELNNQISVLKKDHSESIKNTELQFRQRDQKLSLMVHTAENKYHATKDELGKLLEQQIEVVNRYKHECSQLTEKINANQKGYSNQLKDLKNQHEKFGKIVNNLEEENYRLQEELCAVKKDNQKITINLKESEEITQSHIKKLIVAANKQNHLMRERQLLCDEVEFLRAQISTQKESDNLTPYLTP